MNITSHIKLPLYGADSIKRRVNRNRLDVRRIDRSTAYGRQLAQNTCFHRLESASAALQYQLPSEGKSYEALRLGFHTLESRTKHINVHFLQKESRTKRFGSISFRRKAAQSTSMSVSFRRKVARSASAQFPFGRKFIIYKVETSN